MSHNIPVGDVLNEAFQFGLKRWGTVLRLGWAPVVVSLLLAGGYFALILDFEVLSSANESQTFPGFSEIFKMPVSAVVALGVVFYVLIGLIYCGVMASIFRLVALGEESPGFIHVRLDGPAWRVFWASIISALISLAIWCVAFLIALPITGNSIGSYLSEAGAAFAGMMAAVESGSEDAAAVHASGMFSYWRTFMYAFAIAFIPLIYVGVRLQPFIAGSAAENRLILFGSLKLTEGKFWPVLGAMFLMGLMIILISIVYELFSSVIELLMGLGGAGGAFAIIAALMGFIYFAVTVFYYAVVYGAQLAFSAIIYRRLKTGE
ncbi:hypothetical protein [Hyphococcus sp.]|uniref:hypothetical protein n=1 Tax=Hyphococcus sp. TaxID=2038636 RepID=UPI0035C6EE80